MREVELQVSEPMDLLIEYISYPDFNSGGTGITGSIDHVGTLIKLKMSGRTVYGCVYSGDQNPDIETGGTTLPQGEKLQQLIRQLIIGCKSFIAAYKWGGQRCLVNWSIEDN